MGDEVLRITQGRDQAGLVIAGEIDESGYALLLQSLAALPPRGEVHIDLGHVEFCDLAGLRAILSVAEPASDAHLSRRLIVHAMPPQLSRILQILGWDAMPGVTSDPCPIPARQDQPTCP
jgi:anti-anti-sigma regulatory factor